MANTQQGPTYAQQFSAQGGGGDGYAGPQPAYIAWLGPNALKLTDAYGNLQQLDAIWSMSVQPSGNAANVQLGRVGQSGTDIRFGDTIYCPAGEWTQICDNGELSAFGAAWFQNAVAGAPATLELFMTCKGG